MRTIDGTILSGHQKLMLFFADKNLLLLDILTLAKMDVFSTQNK